MNNEKLKLMREAALKLEGDPYIYIWNLKTQKIDQFKASVLKGIGFYDEITGIVFTNYGMVSGVYFNNYFYISEEKLREGCLANNL